MQYYKKFLPKEVVKELDLLDDKAIESMITDREKEIYCLKWDDFINEGYDKHTSEKLKKVKLDKDDLKYYLHCRTKSKLKN